MMAGNNGDFVRFRIALTAHASPADFHEQLLAKQLTQDPVPPARYQKKWWQRAERAITVNASKGKAKAMRDHLGDEQLRAERPTVRGYANSALNAQHTAG